MSFSLQSVVLVACVLFGNGATSSWGFDMTRQDNLAVYYGQNSYGATHPDDTANWQKTLSFYCQDDSIDTFPIAFVDIFFGEGGLPSLNMANICNDVDDPVFSGSDLPNCQFLAADIETCQAKGKIVTLSLGGATGAASFSSDTQAQQFADTIWNTFLGGSSSTRPFGAAVLDGVDLDIEGGGSSGYAAFVTQIRSHASGASKPYYITAAPQCPFPDANLGSVINAVGFDAIYVQFYNNFCSVAEFSNPNDWNFATWDNWAKTTSPNKNVKVYIGAPASPTAAGSGFVDVATLGNIAVQTRAQFSSFGGIMLWDASQAFANDRFDAAIKALIADGTTPPTSTTTSHTTITTTTTTKPPTTTTTTTTTKPPTTTSTPITTTSTPTTTFGSGSCAGVAAWNSAVAYVGGSQVTSGGHLWTAKWWSEADVPGGVAGDWTDDGPCTTAKVATAKVDATSVHLSAAATTLAPATKSAVAVSAKANEVPKASVAISTASAIPKASIALSSVQPDASSSVGSAEGKSRRQNSRFFKS